MADENSLSDEATLAGATRQLPASEVSLGNDRTLGDGRSEQDTVIDDIEVVDLEARYRVEGTLGQGGMGAVLLATDTRLDRKVAIKRILGEAAGDRMAVQRFLTEAKAIAALNHPNIVQLYDYGRAKDGPFLIMEYVDGGSLLDRCRDSALPLDEAIDLACQLCDGLSKAHDLGIFHRDIKPANVLLTRDGIPKLTDFGLAKAQASDHGQTMTGAVLGTPDFMSPEQSRDASLVDYRSDLWSLAATVYQMVTGRSPKVIRLHELPQSLQPVLAKALEDRKDTRYQSARELRDAIKAATGRIGAATQATAVAPVIADDLQEGQCKACGAVTSDLTKKFCRNPKCGASLRAACLKCEAQIPVWDGVCGECGGNQPALVEERSQALSAQRAKAEKLATALAFDEAIASVEGMAAESRPEFASFVAWAKEFIESSTKERDQLRAAAEQSLEDAIRHHKACDYPAAIHAIETIPEPLRYGTAGLVLEQCRSHHEESERLIGEIAERIKRKELSGLLPLVERAASLRQDRQDLSKILGQLRERRDGSVARAQQALKSGDLKRAAAALGELTQSDLCDRGSKLFAHVQRAMAIETRLMGAVAAAKADGVVTPGEARNLLSICAESLRLNPRSDKVLALAAKCSGIANPPLLRNSIGIELKLLPAGSFTMGQQGGESDSAPHKVTLTRSFYLGVHEVTNAQWKRVMGRVPSHRKDAARPVENVSWEEAVEFCRGLSALPGEKKAGRVYRLPTEAEWEYACRAGTTTKWSCGDNELLLGEYAWFTDNSNLQTHPVGQKKPNAWGLYDMHGNVWEWCSDWYGKYPSGAVTDPQGPSGGSGRVRRGGCWFLTSGHCRSAFRFWERQSCRDGDLGFRLALSPF